MAQLSPAPLQEPVDVKGGSLTPSWMQFFSELGDVVRELPSYAGASYVSPANGFAVQLADTDAQQVVLVVAPAGDLATGTVAFPPNPQDGLSVLVVPTANVTAISLTSSATVANPPSGLSAGNCVQYFYRAENSTWYRLR